MAVFISGRKLYTPFMLEDFQRRTYNHIRLVNECAGKLGFKAEFHDGSKMEDPELLGYILLHWSKQSGDTPASEYKALIDFSIRSHLLKNKHHPEYWDPVNFVCGRPVRAYDMDPLAMREMACDLAAMSIEFKNDPTDFFRSRLESKWLFNPDQISMFEQWFEHLKAK